MTPVALLLLAILACTGQGERKSGSEIWDKEELVVILDADLPGYIALDGEHLGYHYDILQDYAERIGASLRVIPGVNRSEWMRMLDEGQADMVAAIATDDYSDQNPVIDIYTTSYVMLTTEPLRRARRNADVGFPDLRNKKILVSSGFKTSRDYDRMIDSMRHSQTYISDDNAAGMMGSLAAGDYDYLICEKSEALLYTASWRGLRTVCDFNDDIRIGVLLNGNIKEFRKDFMAWLGEYRSGHEYNTLSDLYLETPNMKALSTFRNAGGPQSISQYDDVIRLVAQREQLDWRFLSAIAYHESRFKSHVVSHMGARGIMQVMPVVARNFNIPVEEITDTETNVTLAAKLIKNIEASMGFSSGISGRDKMSIVLACYNAGTGHITDARRLARKYGYNADSWENVSQFLKLKSQPEYYNDEVVRNGMFRNGVQTSAFVENVMDQYNNYRILASK